MNKKELIAEAMKLPLAECFAVIDELLHSLRTDPELDRIWIEEADRRLQAYREGKVKDIPASDVIGEFWRVSSSHSKRTGLLDHSQQMTKGRVDWMLQYARFELPC